MHGCNLHLNPIVYSVLIICPVSVSTCVAGSIDWAECVCVCVLCQVLWSVNLTGHYLGLLENIKNTDTLPESNHLCFKVLCIKFIREMNLLY